MFGWRKRSEEFEWREYVRTTILVRRQERRQRMDDAKAAAVFGVKQAGRRGANAAAEGASAAGRGLQSWASWAADAAWRAGLWSARKSKDGARRAAAVGSAGVAAAAKGAGRAAQRGATTSWSALQPLLERLRDPRIALPSILIGLIALVSTFHALRANGLDGQSALAGLVALLALAIGMLPWVTTDGVDDLPRTARAALDRAGGRLVQLPGFGRMSERGASLVVLAVIATALGAGALIISAAPTTRSQVAARAPVEVARVSSVPAPAVDPTLLVGRASATAGDQIKIAGRVLKIEGIEAPEPGQICVRDRFTWKCGAAARSELARAVRGQRVSCSISGRGEDGADIGRCATSRGDLGAELVAAGHVFAESGFFARYASEEQDARSKKLGLWAGEADRPADFRAKRWEEAKRSAPDGCPIKGRVAADGRTYVLPWSTSYERVKLSSARGERWFCSETEAAAAGWRRSAPL